MFKIIKYLLVLFSFLLSFQVNATNGYFLIGYGSESRAMGGTGVADNRGGMAAAFNPATMIDSEDQFQLGAELFIPKMAVKHESGALGYTDEESNHDLFLIPSMGGTWKWNEKTALGFAFIGAGLKTEYNQTVNNRSCPQVSGACPPTVFNVGLAVPPANEAGVELVQMQLIPSIAYKINKTHTIGASIVLATQYFRAEGFEDFAALGFTATGGSDGLTGEGWSSSDGGGYRLGWLGKFMDEKLRLGVNYSSRVWMDKFARYTNLFAEQGDFDIPESYSVGIAYDFTPAVTVAFDVQQVIYSDIASISNPGPDASNPSSFFSLCEGLPSNDPCKLGGSLGLGFGWEDQTVYKLGANWSLNEKWDLRAGYNYGKSPIPEEEVLFNMLAPATPEHHLTIGAGWAMATNWQLDMNFMYAFLNTIKGPTAFGEGGAIVEGSNASIAMKQYSLGATVAYKF